MRIKTLICPMCKTYLGTHDGITNTPLICDCRKCFKRIIYRPVQNEVAIKDIPDRATVSGRTFY